MQNDKKHLLDALGEVRDVRIGNIVTSQSLKNHPMTKVKLKLRASYYSALEYFVSSCSDDKVYTDARLAQYRSLLVGNNTTILVTEKNRNDVLRSIVNDLLRPWRRKYRYWLFCDVALILSSEQSIVKAQRLLVEYLSHKQSQLMEKMIAALYSDEPVPLAYAFAENLITQFRVNRNFTTLTEKRYIVTANMSAGKSTLINALIGKPVTRTSQEACTANLCFLYNKPFEDNAVHLLASPLNLNASYEDLVQHDETEVSYISSFFRALERLQERICIIDTPGVNSAINREHGKLTRNALKEEAYDHLIYVFNASRLGTDEELRHLMFITNNVPKDKITFVLNKLDHFNKQEDSIEASIESVRNDLLGLGYEKPIVCPISAYFAFLIKMKQNGEPLTEDENEEYELYAKKFSKPEYDLSHYYGQPVTTSAAEDELMALAIKCGLYGLERTLYGGKPKQ